MLFTEAQKNKGGIMGTKIRKILLVEDNPGDVGILEQALVKYAPGEFDMTEAGCMQDALVCLSEETFDAILLDLFLPDAFGLEALARVRVSYPHIPVIALTSMLDEKASLHALSMGARDYFCKDQLSWEKVIGALKNLGESRNDSSRESAAKS